MEALRQLQALDYFLVILWSGAIAWGFGTGAIRQVGSLVAIYAATIGAGQLYKLSSQGLALALGANALPQSAFIAYVLLFIGLAVLLSVVFWRGNRRTALRRYRGFDRVGGGLIAFVWGAMVVIVIITTLRLFTATFWPGEEFRQQTVGEQVHGSRVAPVLQVVLSPLWSIMAPWFPTPVPANFGS